jgi:uncharacterized protein YoxC
MDIVAIFDEMNDNLDDKMKRLNQLTDAVNILADAVLVLSTRVDKLEGK